MMASKKVRSALEFIQYLSKPMEEKDIIALYQNNSIVNEKVLLYKDFIISLHSLIIDTYLGDDLIVTDIQKENHFIWCWDKNITNFNEEGFNFDNNIELFDWFKNFYYVSFYSEEDKSYDTLDKVLDQFISAFSNSKSKTEYDMDLFIELYLIFEKKSI